MIANLHHISALYISSKQRTAILLCLRMTSHALEGHFLY